MNVAEIVETPGADEAVAALAMKVAASRSTVIEPKDDVRVFEIAPGVPVQIKQIVAVAEKDCPRCNGAGAYRVDTQRPLVLCPCGVRVARRVYEEEKRKARARASAAAGKTEKPASLMDAERNVRKMEGLAREIRKAEAALAERSADHDQRQAPARAELAAAKQTIEKGRAAYEPMIADARAVADQGSWLVSHLEARLHSARATVVRLEAELLAAREGEAGATKALIAAEGAGALAVDGARATFVRLTRALEDSDARFVAQTAGARRHLANLQRRFEAARIRGVVVGEPVEDAGPPPEAPLEEAAVTVPPPPCHLGCTCVVVETGHVMVIGACERGDCRCRELYGVVVDVAMPTYVAPPSAPVGAENT